MSEALPVKISAAARADQARLADFLAGQSLQAANRALLALSEAFQRLSRHPAIGRLAGGDRRELSVRFGASGYVIQYRIDAEAIVVARIFHTRERRPSA